MEADLCVKAQAMDNPKGRAVSRPFFVSPQWFTAAQRSTRIVLVLSATLGIASLAGLIATKGSPVFDDRTLVSVAALSFAVFSFFLRSVQNEVQSRKQHTIKVLFDTRLSAEFRTMLELRREHFPLKVVIDPKKYRNFLEAKRSETLSEQEATSRRRSAEALRSLLNYYEFVAFGVEMKDLDKELLRGTIRAIMCNLVQDARYAIADSQNDSPSHYEHLAKLYSEWRDDRFEPIPPPGTPLPAEIATSQTRTTDTFSPENPDD